MSKTKLSVETPYGTVTRTTERAYKFVVVSFGQDETYLRRRHAEAVAYSAKQAAKYRKAEATGGQTEPVYSFTPEEYGKWAADAEAKAAEPFIMPEAKLGVHGWTGSTAGASKMINEALKYGYRGVVAVPVPGK